MKKCPYCGLANPDEGVKCTSCQTPLDAPSGTTASPAPTRFKRFLPFLLSYFVVTSGVFLYSYVKGQRAGIPFPPHTVFLNTTLSSDELAAKLVRAGVPMDAVLFPPQYKPNPWPPLERHFVLFGISFLAFAGFARLFQKIFKK